MLNNDKKKKIRKLLATLEPQEEAKLLTKNLEEDIKVLESRIENSKDYSDSIKKITEGIFKLRDFIVAKLPEFADKASITQLEINTLEGIESLEKRLSISLANVESDVLGLNSEVAGFQIENDKEVKELRNLLDEWKLDLTNKINDKGGGAQNQKISIAGTVMSTRYADFNLIGSGITITKADNNTAKRVDITFTGVTPVYPVTSVSNSDSTLTISPTTGAVIASLNLSNANTWLAKQTFSVADTTYTVGAPSGLSVTFTLDGGGFFANGTTYAYTIYSYRSTGLGTVYEAVGSNSSNTDPNDSNNYNVDLSWSAGASATGYWVYDTVNNRYFDNGAGTTVSITPGTSWNGGSPTLSPTSLSSPNTSLAVRTAADWSTTDIIALEFGYNVGTTLPLRFYWSNSGTGTNRLIFEDAGNTLQTIRANFAGTGLISQFTNDSGYLTTISGGDHNTLSNLTVGDVHTQYARLIGRSGGQTLIGGTASANNLTLQSTSHATKGKLLFGTSQYDEVNNRLAIATTSPLTSATFEINGSQAIYDKNTLGAEKLTNGTFTGSATGWTLGTGWAYSSNTVVKNADGTGTLSQPAVTYSYNIPAIGVTYALTFTISAYSVGSVTPSVGGATGTSVSANGTYTQYFTATSITAPTFTPTNTSRFTIDTVSLKQVLGNLVLGGTISTNGIFRNPTTSGAYLAGNQCLWSAVSTGIVQIGTTQPDSGGGMDTGRGLFIGIDSTTLASGGTVFFQNWLASNGDKGALVFNPNGGSVSVGSMQTDDSMSLIVGKSSSAYIKIMNANGSFGGAGQYMGQLYSNSFTGYTTYVKAATVFEGYDLGGYGRGRFLFALNRTQSGENVQDTYSTSTIMNLDYIQGNVSIGNGVNTGSAKLGLRSTYEQNRIEYDGSNYLKTEVTSTGTAHVTNVGTGSQTIFTDEQTLGAEKVTNGTFAADTDWTKGAAWSISGGFARKTIDGTNTLSQAVGAVAGELYLLTFTITSDSTATASTVTPTLGGTAGSVCINHALGNSALTYTMHILATTTGDLIFTPSNTSRFTLDDVSVKRINGGVVRANSMKVVTGAKNYTSQIGAVGGVISDSYADVTVGGAEADIYSLTTNAGTLGANGDKLVASYGVNFVTGGTELCQLKAYFAGTAIWDSTGVAPTTGTTSARVIVEIIRVSTTVVRYSVSLNTTGASGFVYCTVGELTGLTLSGTNILKLTGTSSGVGSGSGDIIGKMSYVEFKPAS